MRVLRHSGVRLTHRIGVIATFADCALLARALVDDGQVIELAAGANVTIAADEFDMLVVAPTGTLNADDATFDLVHTAMARHPVPVFALLARGDMLAMSRAFDNGAADCAGYPIDPDEVRIRVGALLRRKKIDDRLRADAAEVRRIAHTDPVTGLWNRHYLDADLTAKIARAVALARPLSLLMIDIDRFKPINDRHGHAVGDKVLHAVATRLSGGIRVIDTLARFGGDEIALVMPDTTMDTASAVAERLRALVAEGTTEVPFGVTISIGVAELNLNEPANSLLAKADGALYSAKLNGRNRVAEAS